MGTTHEYGMVESTTLPVRQSVNNNGGRAQRFIICLRKVESDLFEIMFYTIVSTHSFDN